MPRLIKKKHDQQRVELNGNGKSRIGAHYVGPAFEGHTAVELDKRDSAEGDNPEYSSWLNLRKTVVDLGKRMGVFKAGDPDVLQAPQTVADDADLDSFGQSDFVDDTIEPPFDPTTLCMIYENSNSLRQNVDAMVTNIDGFGHLFESVLDFTDSEIDSKVRDILFRKALDDSESAPDDLLTLTDEQISALEPDPAEVEATRKRWERIATVEKGRIKCFFEFINPIDPLVEVRKATREDLEILGNSGWEVIREDPIDSRSKITQIYRVPFISTKLIRADRKPTEVEMIIRKDEIHFDTVKVQRFFRRFVRITGSSRVYYKEFGDPRVISRSTGMIYETIEALQTKESESALPANELYHWKIRSLVSPYGVPRWMGVLLSVLGSRAAEEVNFLYFDNKAIPPMILLVSGGRVSEQSVSNLENYIEDRIKGRENFHKIMILEGLPASEEVSEGNLEHSGKLRIELKPLMGDLQQDALFQNYDANNMTKVGRSFRQPQILTGDTRDMNRSCYSDDTETLTENGWKLIDEIAADEKVAAYDPEKHRVEFVIPAERHVHEVENELLYHFENAHTDILVTAEHKMLMRPFYERTESEREWRGVEAKDLNNTRFRFRVAPDVGSWRAPGLAPFMTVPRLESCTNLRKDGHQHEPIQIEDFLEFLGYWISEGSLLQTQDPMSPYWVTLSQKKPKVREKIQALLDRLPWRYSVYEAKDGTTRWKISNKCLRDYLLQNCGGKSGDKRIPAAIMQSSEAHLRVIYQALMDGDGTADSRENRTARIYYTKSTVLADQVQEVTFLLGYRTRIVPGAGVWRVEHSEHSETCMTRERHLTLVPYTGRVYCFSVPSHGYFVTRRNGKVAIQGNTAEIAKAFAEEQIYQPARDSFDACMDRHFLTSIKIHFWRFKSKAPVQRIPNDLIDNVKKSLDSGGIVPNEARKLLSDAFSVEFGNVDEDWAKLPPKIALAEARAGATAQTTASADGTGRAADQIQSAEGALVARGKTTIAHGHDHVFVALQSNGKVRVVTMPGGEDGHSHPPTEATVKPGKTTKLTLEVTEDHTHDVEFTAPLSKRKREARAGASVLMALRAAVQEELEEQSGDWLDQIDRTGESENAE